MFGMLSQMLGLAWKILSFGLVVSLFFGLMRGGKDTIRNIRDTLVLAIKVAFMKIQKWLFNKYKEQSEDKPAEPKSEEP